LHPTTHTPFPTRRSSDLPAIVVADPNNGGAHSRHSRLIQTEVKRRAVLLEETQVSVRRLAGRSAKENELCRPSAAVDQMREQQRSEERRVGKECRAGRGA